MPLTSLDPIDSYQFMTTTHPSNLMSLPYQSLSTNDYETTFMENFIQSPQTQPPPPPPAPTHHPTSIDQMINGISSHHQSISQQPLPYGLLIAAGGGNLGPMIGQPNVSMQSANFPNIQTLSYGTLIGPTSSNQSQIYAGTLPRRVRVIPSHSSVSTTMTTSSSGTLGSLPFVSPSQSYHHNPMLLSSSSAMMMMPSNHPNSNPNNPNSNNNNNNPNTINNNNVDVEANLSSPITEV